MPRFIEEFYYGNIDPQARSTKENSIRVCVTESVIRELIFI